MMPHTVNPVFLTSSFAMDFWLNWHEAGTILHLGKKTDNFALSIGEDGYVTVTMSQNTYRSEAPVPKDKWTFFALNYDTDKKKFNMLALQDKNNIYLFSDKEVSMENAATSMDWPTSGPWTRATAPWPATCATRTTSW